MPLSPARPRHRFDLAKLRHIATDLLLIAGEIFSVPSTTSSSPSSTTKPALSLSLSLSLIISLSSLSAK
ncbi:hypothetical protein RchiOBHm_Chr6g0290201 [Rosa chinensis]|uniref:Uncharacterized protein n=1 Tax=Rosa chinensis TaxID=74649 RepID=A0A2P6PVV5_ROSCH|nr:hypothetical protein RchiOBHm_Chr6g0290201 [Rosa chinensis]